MSLPTTQPAASAFSPSASHLGVTSAQSSTPPHQSIHHIDDVREEDQHHHLGVGEKIKDIMYEHQVLINTFVAGGLAGATSRTVVSPLERLKIILQCQANTPVGTVGQAYGGVWASLGRMWREEGFAGFMKGNGINVVRILPYSAIQFSSYGGFKSLMQTWSGEENLSTLLRLTAGAGAGIVAVAATYPLDLVRARLSIASANMAVVGSTVPQTLIRALSSDDAKLGIVGMTRKVYANEGGVRGLYRGCWATAVGVAPYVSLNFYLYESLKGVILPEDLDHTSISDIELLARKLSCGGLAGATSLLFTHPFDVLRRKLQVAGLSTTGPQYSGALDAMRKIIQTEGFRKGMYRGLVPNIIKVVPSIAVSFWTFETVRDSLREWEQPDDEHVV